MLQIIFAYLWVNTKVLKEIIPKHPLAIRWFHWVNFPVLGVMLWSGLLIYWANDEYRIGTGKTTVFHFFPESFYTLLKIPYHLADGMAYHFSFMWLFMLNGLFYVIYTIVSGEWRYLLPGKGAFGKAWQVVLHDLHIRRALPEQDKYNAAQQIAYTAIILMGIGSVLTGIAVYKPVQAGWLATLLGGYEWARAEHFILAVGYCLFLLVHVVQVAKAGWQNFAGMIRGFEVKQK